MGGRTWAPVPATPRTAGWLEHASRAVGRLRRATRRRLGQVREARLLPHVAFGNEHGLRIGGRAVESAVGRTPPRPASRAGTALHLAWRLARTVAVPRAEIRWRHGGSEGVALADDEGFFDVHVPCDETPSALAPWTVVELSLDGRVWQRVRVRVAPTAGPLSALVDLDRSLVPAGVRGVIADLTAEPNTARGVPGLAPLLRGLTRPAGSTFYVTSAPADVCDLLRERVLAEVT